MKKEFSFEIVEHIATISQSGSTTKELNRVSFAGADPKYDLRTWQNTTNGIRPLKGLTLTDEEAATLKTALNARQEIPDLQARKSFNPFKR